MPSWRLAECTARCAASCFTVAPTRAIAPKRAARGPTGNAPHAAPPSRPCPDRALATRQRRRDEFDSRPARRARTPARPSSMPELSARTARSSSRRRSKPGATSSCDGPGAANPSPARQTGTDDSQISTSATPAGSADGLSDLIIEAPAVGSPERRECSQWIVSAANVPKSVPIGHENGPRRSLRGPFRLVAGTGFEPATSGL